MKKIAQAVAFMMGAALSGSAFAVTAFTVSDSVTAGTAGDCPLLSDAVTLSVSSNVVGAWDCNETTAIIKVAACHQGGSRDTGVACSTDNDTSTTTWDAPDGCTTNTGNSTIPSFKAFGSTSEGGVMGEYSMDQRCETGQITGITLW